MIHTPRTLLWRLGLALMAVQAAAVLLLGWYAAVTFRDYNREQTIAELQRLMPFLLHRYGPHAKEIIEKRLALWVTIGTVLMIVGIFAAVYLFLSGIGLTSSFSPPRGRRPAPCQRRGGTGRLTR